MAFLRIVKGANALSVAFRHMMLDARGLRIGDFGRGLPGGGYTVLGATAS